ncbi:MAG: NAD-dependent epimerase/dehydratase family protein [Verrucomicrobiota bacterium]
MVVHGDLRMPMDLEALPEVNFVIDCAAQASVLAGTAGSGCTAAQLTGHNLSGTLNLLEYCRRHGAGLALLSTSRVYSIPTLASLPLVIENEAFVPAPAALANGRCPAGFSSHGIAEDFSTAAPVSLYGATKLASEQMALEYGHAFGFPVWVNRCGVLAGAGQFGKADQGIFSYWIREWAARRPLRHIGFGGTGHQVRDCLHPADLAPLLLSQIDAGMADDRPRILNLGGGPLNSTSLSRLGDWCRKRLGPHQVAADSNERPYDLPWVVMNSALAARTWDWRPRHTLEEILEEIACWATNGTNVGRGHLPWM